MAKWVKFNAKMVNLKNEELEDMNSVILYINEIINKQICQIADNKQNSPPALIV